MASSFFRGSCAIFWLAWLMSLAYVLGITVYESKYILLTESYNYESFVVKTVCIMTIAMALVGCVFVKCDISHIFCFILYTLPLLLIVPALCIFAIILSKQAHNSELDHLKAVKDSWDATETVPIWLKVTQVEFKCCGVFSWKDYLLTVSSVPKDPPVPASCCKVETTTHCLETGLKDFIVNKNMANEDLRDLNFPYLNPKYQNVIHTMGCNQSLMGSVESAKEAHFAFMIILLILSLLMAMVYIRNWCASRHHDGSRSDHSLDVETVSLLDIPPAEPMLLNYFDTKDISRPLNQQESIKTASMT